MHSSARANGLKPRRRCGRATPLHARVDLPSRRADHDHATPLQAQAGFFVSAESGGRAKHGSNVNGPDLQAANLGLANAHSATKRLCTPGLIGATKRFL